MAVHRSSRRCRGAEPPRHDGGPGGPGPSRGGVPCTPSTGSPITATDSTSTCRPGRPGRTKTWSMRGSISSVASSGACGWSERRVAAAGSLPPAAQASTTASCTGRSTGLCEAAFRSSHRSTGRGPARRATSTAAATGAGVRWRAGRATARTSVSGQWLRTPMPTSTPAWSGVSGGSGAGGRPGATKPACRSSQRRARAPAWSPRCLSTPEAPPRPGPPAAGGAAAPAGGCARPARTATTCSTSAPAPARSTGSPPRRRSCRRPGRRGPHTRVALDLGYGTLPCRLALPGSPAADGIDAVVTTRAHPDHVVDLHALLRVRWFTRRAAAAIPLYAPAGVLETLVALEDGDPTAVASVFDPRRRPTAPAHPLVARQRPGGLWCGRPAGVRRRGAARRGGLVIPPALTRRAAGGSRTGVHPPVLSSRRCHQNVATMSA
ncbi:Beta-lactamase superfamily domain-containing protein [Quadrisphaera sp. DSM 44207]|nr:Beta-lactamase superfamily domain-containing protein [Quadrisphaera sp. DSM 44207]